MQINSSQFRAISSPEDICACLHVSGNQREEAKGAQKHPTVHIATLYDIIKLANVTKAENSYFQITGSLGAGLDTPHAAPSINILPHTVCKAESLQKLLKSSTTFPLHPPPPNN